jgi:hypothetical protein
MIPMPSPRLPWFAWPVFAVLLIGAVMYLTAWCIIAALCWLGEAIARATWSDE